MFFLCIKNGCIEFVSEFCGLCNGDVGGELVVINIIYDDDIVRNNKISKGIYYWSWCSGFLSYSNCEMFRCKCICL